MSARTAALACAALLTFGTAILAGTDPVPIRSDVEHRAITRDVQQLVHRAQHETEKLLGITTATPGTLHLHADWDDWVATERRLTRGAFATNGAFTTHARGDAHIAVQPELSDELLDELGLPQLTRRLIAHEASHVVVIAGATAPGKHPDWLSEGIACVVADRALGVDEVESGPTASTRLVLCRRMLTEGRLPRIEEILDDRLSAYERGERYALWWAVGHHLATHHPEALRAGVAVADGGTRPVADAVRKALGDDLTGVDNEFAAWIDEARPLWHEVSRAATVGEDELVQSTFHADALLWRLRELDGDWTFRARVEVLDSRDPGGSTGVLLATDDALLEVRVTHGFGLSVRRHPATIDHRLPDDSGEVLASHPHRNLAGGRSTELRLQARADRLVVRVAGRRITELDLPGVVRRVGFTTSAHTTSRWSRIQHGDR